MPTALVLVRRTVHGAGVMDGYFENFWCSTLPRFCGFGVLGNQGVSLRSRRAFVYRDSRFFDQRGPDGKKIFWGRGNGWVFAGLINILRELPRDYYSRKRYEALFIEMADKLLTRQRPDGFWSASLLSRPELSVAESSGTAFFTYGIASGINLGLLDRGRFAKVALRGWGALIGALNADGRLGRVQQMDDRPGTADVNDSQFYGSGALLLAGTAIKSMIESQ